VAAIATLDSPYEPSHRALAFLQATGAPLSPSSETAFRNHGAAFLKEFLEATREFELLATLPAVQDRGPYGDKAMYLRLMSRYFNNRRLFISQRGYYGLGPAVTWVGDMCVVIPGGRTPFLVRTQRTETPPTYQFVGEAHVVGTVPLMNSTQWFSALGGAEEEWPDWAPEEGDIYLV
jgi:hypothetical protein